MKNGSKSIRNPSAKARFKIRRVVMERWRVRARMLQMISRFPEMPIGRKMQRIRATVIVPALLLMAVSVILFVPELVMLEIRCVVMVWIGQRGECSFSLRTTVGLSNGWIHHVSRNNINRHQSIYCALAQVSVDILSDELTKQYFTKVQMWDSIMWSLSQPVSSLTRHVSWQTNLKPAICRTVTNMKGHDLTRTHRYEIREAEKHYVPLKGCKLVHKG